MTAVTGTTQRSPWLRPVLAGLVVAALLISLVALNYRAASERRRAADWQLHTYSVLLVAGDLAQQVSEMQRGARGYVISGSPMYLEPYRQNAPLITSNIAELKRLTGDNPGQKALLLRLEREVAILRDVVDQTVGRVAAGDRDGAAALVRTDRAERAIRDVRATLAAFRAIETELLARRQAAWFAATVRSNTISYSVAAAALLMALAAAWLWVRGLRTARTAAALAVESRALALSRATLESAVADRTRELAAANAGLQAQIARTQTAEAQVRQLQKLEAVGQLTGGIAHDFNNMLAIVLGSLDLAQRRLGDAIDARAATLIGNAVEGARRAAALTQRLLAFSRQQPLAPLPVDANKFVTGMSELLSRTIGEAIEIETVLSGGLWRTYADGAQLESAIVNLAVNARDAMPEGGKLTIETANSHLDDGYADANAEVAAGQYVAICVTDTGSGMPPEVIERAFDPFYTTKGVGKGTGLGLSQVFGFVKQSGGHVKIYSEVGHGTTVKIYLPRWMGADAPEGTAEPEPELPHGAGETVLVVEDEEQVRHMSVAALTELGYTVLKARDGEAGLAAIEAQPDIALLFTDIVMPGMTGRVLADRALALRPALKVLFTTGYTRNAVVHNGMLDTDVAFLPKPFSLQQLAVKVRQVLDGGGINRVV